MHYESSSLVNGTISPFGNSFTSSPSFSYIIYVLFTFASILARSPVIFTHLLDKLIKILEPDNIQVVKRNNDKIVLNKSGKEAENSFNYSIGKLKRNNQTIPFIMANSFATIWLNNEDMESYAEIILKDFVEMLK